MLARADLLRLLQTLVAEVGPDLTVREFQAATGIPPKTVNRLWVSWGQLRRAAGLPVRGATRNVYSDDELFAALSRAGEECGRFPTANAFRRVSGRSWQTLERRFGTRIAVWQAYREWLRGEPVESWPAYVRALPDSKAPEQVPGLLAQGSWRRKSAGSADDDSAWGTDFELPEADPAEILADWLETHRRLREMGNGRSGKSEVASTNDGVELREAAERSLGGWEGPRPSQTPGAPPVEPIVAECGDHDNPSYASAEAGPAGPSGTPGAPPAETIAAECGIQDNPRSESAETGPAGPRPPQTLAVPPREPTCSIAAECGNHDNPNSESAAGPRPAAKPKPITPKDWSRYKRGLYSLLWFQLAAFSAAGYGFYA